MPDLDELRRLAEAERDNFADPDVRNAYLAAANPQTVLALLDRLDELAETLQDLADLQNGPPLIRDEDEWRETMARAGKLLGWERVVSDDA